MKNRRKYPPNEDPQAVNGYVTVHDVVASHLKKKTIPDFSLHGKQIFAVHSKSE